MPKQTFRIRAEPLFDLVSRGRGGPRETGPHFTPAQVEQIRRTVERAPEGGTENLRSRPTTEST